VSRERTLKTFVADAWEAVRNGGDVGPFVIGLPKGWEELRATQRADALRPIHDMEAELARLVPQVGTTETALTECPPSDIAGLEARLRRLEARRDTITRYAAGERPRLLRHADQHLAMLHTLPVGRWGDLRGNHVEGMGDVALALALFEVRDEVLRLDELVKTRTAGRPGFEADGGNGELSITFCQLPGHTIAGKATVADRAEFAERYPEPRSHLWTRLMLRGGLYTRDPRFTTQRRDVLVLAETRNPALGILPVEQVVYGAVGAAYAAAR